jgi:Tol biopolymer transport system component/DNA-binding winged helix-turn-helix (wHTH) protein
MASQIKQLYEFGPFRLDTGERVLLRAGALVPLTPKALDTLIALVRNGGHVLEKEELLKAVWPDTFVEEATLAQNVFTLRKALGNGQGDGQRYIETIPRRGYRFIAPVRELPYEDEDAPHVTEAHNLNAQIDAPAASGEQPTRADVLTSPTFASAETDVQILAPPQRSRLGALVIAAALVCVLALAVLVLLKFVVRRQTAPAQVNTQAMKLTRLPINGRVVAATISPDGRVVAYLTEEAGAQSIWVRQTTTTSSPQQIVPPGDMNLAAINFARSGEFVYYAAWPRDGSQPPALYQVPAFGGTPKKLLAHINSNASFAPDGRRFVVLRADDSQPRPEMALVIADADGANERVLLKRAAPNFLNAPTWSPDGQSIAYVTGSFDPSPGYAVINTVRLSDGVEQTLGTSRWYSVGDLAWLPDGKGLVAQLAEQELSPTQLWRIDYPSGAARRITNDLNSYAGVSLTADASALVTLQTDLVSNIWVMPQGDMTRAAQVTQGPGKYDGYYGMSWTPDGSKIVYASIASGAWDIWQMNADGTGVRQLTLDARSNYGPSVSPDGRYIVFVSNRAGGAFHVWRMNADGTNPVQLTAGDSENFAHVTADGRWVIYASVGYGTPNYIWKVPLEGGTPVRLTDHVASWPFPAPDGKTFTCTYHPDNGPVKLALISLAGGAPLKLFALPPTFRANTVFAPDGRAIYFLDGRAGNSNIWAQPLDGSAPRAVTSFKSEGILAYDWSRAGMLACARGVETTGVVLIRAFK